MEGISIISKWIGLQRIKKLIVKHKNPILIITRIGFYFYLSVEHNVKQVSRGCARPKSYH